MKRCAVDVRIYGVLIGDPNYCEKADNFLSKFGNAPIPILDDRDLKTETECIHWEGCAD